MLFNLFSLLPDKPKGQIMALLLVCVSLGIGPAERVFTAWQEFEAEQAMEMFWDVIDRFPLGSSLLGTSDPVPEMKKPARAARKNRRSKPVNDPSRIRLDQTLGRTDLPDVVL